MNENILGAALAFAGGIAVAALNYGISKWLLIHKPGAYAASQIARQLLQIGYLVLLYLGGAKTPWSPLWLLVGGCLGVTLPMAWFTVKLVRLNDSLYSGKEEPSDG